MSEEIGARASSVLGTDCTFFFSFMLQATSFADLKQQITDQKEVQDFAALLRKLSTQEQRDDVLEDLVGLLPEADSFRGGIISLLCGSLVEGGGSLSIPIDHVMGLLMRQLRQIKEYDDSELHLNAAEMFERFPDACRADRGLRYSLPPVMTMLSRDKDVRKKWQHHQELVDLVEGADELPFYFESLLTLLDDRDIFVVDVQNKRVFVVRLVGVQDGMSHFFALVQHSLLEHAGQGYLNATPPDPLGVRFAQNNHLTPADYQRIQEYIEVPCFDFCYPGGLFLPCSCKFNELPTFQNKPLVTVRAKGSGDCPQIQWSPANMYPILHEKLESRVDLIRELSGDELDVWVAAVADCG